ncbi:MAG: hypothetical protein JSW63_10805 [Ignavibacterium sp.]|nr:MAG: hypothetical protein JSW63_10805 [Ignavibacterium sp.]
MGAYRVHQEWDFVGAGEAFERAKVLNPNLSGIYGTEYVWYLAYIGKTEEAIIEAKRLMQVDPLSYTTRMTANYAYYCAGQFSEAIELCKRTLELEPQNIYVYEDLAKNYEQMSLYRKAHNIRLSALKISGVAGEAITVYDSLYNILEAKAYPQWLRTNRDILSGWGYNSLCFEAWIYTRLGENENALSLLEKAYDEKEGELVTLKIDPKWDPLREEIRFQRLLERMNFPN